MESLKACHTKPFPPHHAGLNSRAAFFEGAKEWRKLLHGIDIFKSMYFPKKEEGALFFPPPFSLSM